MRPSPTAPSSAGDTTTSVSWVRDRRRASEERPANSPPSTKFVSTTTERASSMQDSHIRVPSPSRVTFSVGEVTRPANWVWATPRIAAMVQAKWGLHSRQLISAPIHTSYNSHLATRTRAHYSTTATSSAGVTTPREHLVVTTWRISAMEPAKWDIPFPSSTWAPVDARFRLAPVIVSPALF